jgi:hypothetical protein
MGSVHPPRVLAIPHSLKYLFPQYLSVLNYKFRFKLPPRSLPGQFSTCRYLLCVLCPNSYVPRTIHSVHCCAPRYPPHAPCLWHPFRIAVRGEVEGVPAKEELLRDDDKVVDGGT